MTQFLKRTFVTQNKKRRRKKPSTNAQIRPDSTVNCLVASVFLGGLETWILPILFVGQLGSGEPGALPWECWVLAVSWQSRPPSLLRGPCTDGHSLVNWKNAYHCLTQRAPLLPPPPPPPPPPLRHLSALRSTNPPSSCRCSHRLSLHPSLACLLHLSLTFSLWISVRTPTSSGPSLGLNRTLLLTAAVSLNTHWQTTESPTVCLHLACVQIMDPPKALVCSASQMEAMTEKGELRLSMKCLMCNKKKRRKGEIFQDLR